MEPDGPTCAIGACGVLQWPDLVSATSGGSLDSALDLAETNLWNVDASKIIFSHTDIYKGRIANLVWELIDLPRPKYVHYPDFPAYRAIGNEFHQDIASRHRQAMAGINYFRQLGEPAMKSVNESNTIAFEIDENLRKGNWVAVEKGIREFTKKKLQYHYPGWVVKFGLGFVGRDFTIGSADVSIEWHLLNIVSINLLLVYALYKQGRCDEAAQVMDEFIRPSPLYQSEAKQILEAAGSIEIRMLNCHK